MTLVDQLQNKTPDERARLKARWFSELPTRTFTRGQFQVTLSNHSFVDKTFSVDVVVKKNGVEILRDDFHFVNPPIMVPDGTTRKEVDPRSGEVFDALNFKEDIVEALKTILVDAIKTQIKI